MVYEVSKSLFTFVMTYVLILVYFGIMIKFITKNPTLGNIYDFDDGTADKSETFYDNLYNIYLQSLGAWSNGEISFGLFLNIIMFFMIFQDFRNCAGNVRKKSEKNLEMFRKSSENVRKCPEMFRKCPEMSRKK